jgi:hypothetical protein
MVLSECRSDLLLQEVLSSVRGPFLDPALENADQFVPLF